MTKKYKKRFPGYFFFSIAVLVKVNPKVTHTGFRLCDLQ